MLHRGRRGAALRPEDHAMTELEFEAKLAELDRLLNDPEVRMDPDRVWSLLAELSAHEARGAAGRR
jgi:hypothetical protein